MRALGILLLVAGVALAAVAVFSRGPFLGALLGPILVVAGWHNLDLARQRRARARARRRGGYVYPRR